MSGLVQRIVAAFATFASFVGLVFSLHQPGSSFTFIQTSLTIISIVAFLFNVYFEIRDYRRSRPRVMRDGGKIRNYMYRWINSGGRVAVFSRSLSWIADNDMRTMMMGKARDGDLTVVMPTPAGVGPELMSAGARVIYYGDDDYVIRSRFTIINRGRTDTAVAIGRTDDRGKHIITEHKASDADPAYWLAEDLIELMIRRSASPGPTQP